MLNIDTLDNVIALVVVILLLSLIVQAIQGMVKKLLRVKSKQLEASLLDLFDAVQRGRRTQLRKISWVPRFFAPSAEASGDAQKLLAAVKTEMSELGRVSALGTFTLDSLSKSDLLNVLARVDPDRVAPGILGGLQKAMKTINTIDAAMKKVAAADLPGEANAIFMKLQEKLAPLRQHYKSLTNGGQVKPGLVVADVLALRDLVFSDALDLLGRVQQIAATSNAPALAAQLAEVSTALNNARESLDDAFASFRAKLVETEQWFDTTMQSFEERYQRGMRTWTIVISFAVAAVLDANILAIYSAISADATMRAAIIASHTRVEAAGKEPSEAEKKPADDAQKTPPATDSTGTTTAAATTAPPATTTQTPAPPPLDLEAEQERIRNLAGIYTSYGFRPFTLERLRNSIADVFTTAPHPVNGSWGTRRLHNLRTLFGWTFMALLLSLGAPFWHDALESLFGVKNLLRRRTETQNVEQARGAGNPKP